MTGIISFFSGLGRVHQAEGKTDKALLAGGQTRLVGKVACFKIRETKQKIYLLCKVFSGERRCSVVDVLHVEAQARGQTLNSWR